MGNCVGGVQFVAKETFHPTEDAFHDFPLDKEDVEPEKHAEDLKKEKPLKITMDDKLKMLSENTEIVISGGTRMYKMKNISTGQTGLVMSDCVAKIGTVECEK